MMGFSPLHLTDYHRISVFPFSTAPFFFSFSNFFLFINNYYIPWRTRIRPRNGYGRQELGLTMTRPCMRVTIAWMNCQGRWEPAPAQLCGWVRLSSPLPPLSSCAWTLIFTAILPSGKLNFLCLELQNCVLIKQFCGFWLILQYPSLFAQIIIQFIGCYRVGWYERGERKTAIIIKSMKYFYQRVWLLKSIGIQYEFWILLVGGMGDVLWLRMQLVENT